LDDIIYSVSCSRFFVFLQAMFLGIREHFFTQKQRFRQTKYEKRRRK